jgi:hypothetical protein
MILEDASRQKVKIKMALQGPSGSGKTMSALLLAYGLCKDYTRIAVIDTENRSSMLYAHLGNFKVIHIPAPFTPENYIKAMKICEARGMEVIILDSISHEWESILDEHGNMTGNSYTNWNKLTPRHNAFIQHILQSPCHVIGTIRAKQEYVLSEKNGKQVPEKMGMKGVTRDGMDYEFTLVLELDMKNMATATKDRTSMFMKKPSFMISERTGTSILNWCNNEANITDAELTTRINDCKTLDELIKLYYNHPPDDESINTAFSRKRMELQKQAPTSLVNTKPLHTNGTYSTSNR